MSRFIYGSALCAAILFLASFGGLRAQETVAYNTTLFDTLNPSTAGRYSALWGYTAPDGREYALLGGFSGTHIVDITTKPIRQVAFTRGKGGEAPRAGPEESGPAPGAGGEGFTAFWSGEAASGRTLDGRLRDYVIVMKGAERIEPDRVEEMTVRDGETIAVFPPVAGG